jgi:uncharacterized protein DUF3224
VLANVIRMTDQSDASTAAGSAPTTVTGEFEVVEWDDTLYFESENPEGTKLARVTVRKTFTGAVAGTSVTELLTAGAGTGRGYVASELFEGSINGRKGTVVFQHGGVGDKSGGEAFGSIVPGTGSDELAGLRGKVTYRHDESGAVITLTLHP